MSGPILSKDTATDIALAHREVSTAEGLLAEVRETMDKHRHAPSEIRDAFGRTQYGLQLGVPSGKDSQRLFNVPFALAEAVIEAHIAHHRARLVTLTHKAREEIGASA